MSSAFVCAWVGRHVCVCGSMQARVHMSARVRTCVCWWVCSCVRSSSTDNNVVGLEWTYPHDQEYNYANCLEFFKSYTSDK